MNSLLSALPANRSRRSVAAGGSCFFVGGILVADRRSLRIGRRAILIRAFFGLSEAKKALTLRLATFLLPLMVLSEASEFLSRGV